MIVLLCQYWPYAYMDAGHCQITVDRDLEDIARIALTGARNYSWLSWIGLPSYVEPQESGTAG
jgi:ABC-type Fe3+ transport system permease subunit